VNVRPSQVAFLLWFLFGIAGAAPARAQERPYFVTYDHDLAGFRELEISVLNTAGSPKGTDSAYSAPWTEIGFGITDWWTTELYLEGVATGRDGSGFTGWRSEHRFRPLKGTQHVNPVLYVEFEHINEASRIQKEITGSGPLPFGPIGDLLEQYSNELEARLIFSSDFRGWNVSENAIFEQNLTHSEGVEFGYAVGVSRALGDPANGKSCRVCLEHFVAGVEAYGGLGTSGGGSVTDTRQYVAPVFAWHLSERTTLKASIGFGLTSPSDHYLVRVGWSYEPPVWGGRRSSTP
jgi:hypothetical protein